MALSPQQLDELQKIARKVNLTSLAVRALGSDADHQAVEEQLVDVLVDLSRARRRGGRVTAHRLVIARSGPNAWVGACSCGATLIAKHPRTMDTVLAVHCERMRKKEEAARLISFIDAHGGRLGAFGGYQQFTNTKTRTE